MILLHSGTRTRQEIELHLVRLKWGLITSPILQLDALVGISFDGISGSEKAVHAPSFDIKLLNTLFKE